MKVSEAKFTRRYNVAQYEHEEYSLTAIVEDDDAAVEVLSQLKADVEAAHSGDAGNVSPAAESSDEETGEEDSETEDSASDSDTEEEDEKKTDARSAKKKKDKKKKAQVYQRSNEAHKEIFSNVLKEVAPNWKKTSASKTTAKSCSVELEGDEFLDEDGNVLPSFRKEVKSFMANI